jgi:5-methylthioadenosine/S-adenosylhomocysteine deaminase
MNTFMWSSPSERKILRQRGEKDARLEGLAELLTSRDVIRFATIQRARDLKLDRKAGSLTPGKEAEIIHM